MRFIIDALQVDENAVCYCAFTGKAAEVLRKKGNKNCLTLHKLLYDFEPRENGGFFKTPKAELEYNIIVVDEISMAPKGMMDLLFTYDCYVLCLGDPGQIPPLDQKDNNHLLDHPHVFLDQIMRQAQESEIIRLSMKIRNGEYLDNFDGKEVKVFPHNKLSTGMLTWADIILTAKNDTRLKVNNQIRKLLGFGDKPQEGDKLICLRNYWDDFTTTAAPIVNGTIGYVKNLREDVIHIPPRIQTSMRTIDIYRADFITDDGILEDMQIDKKMLLIGEKTCSWKDSYKLQRAKKNHGELEPKELTYAYAITGHKSQGSEWEKVLVLEENFPFSREEHKRWLYTACTRASDKLVLIKR